jgi:hypothetical protein
MAVALIAVGAAGLAAPAGPMSPARAAESGRVTATYVEPYSVWNFSKDQVDTMFARQRSAGIDAAIIQWTGAYNGDSVNTIYPADPTTGFTTSSTDLLPRLVASAARNGIHVWLGLALRSNLLDDPSTRADATLLRNVADADARLARDLEAIYSGQFEGWYIPTEPGYETVAQPELTSLHGAYLKQVADSLHAITPSKRVMVSPSVPRAIEGGISGSKFVEGLAPIITNSGIDVWNLQDGFMMTGWTPDENRALVEAGQRLASPVGAEVWATLYTPGPTDFGSNPVDLDSLRADLAALGRTGVPITIWTFNSAFNPDPTLPGSNARRALFNAYTNTAGELWSPGASYTASTAAASAFPDTNGELTDGTRGPYSFTDSAWQGREGQPSQQYTVDLGTERPITTVTLGSLLDAGVGIYHPAAVTVETSGDGRSWRRFASATLATDGGHGTWSARGAAAGRYVKVRVAAYDSGWTFIDEVTVAG